MDVYLFIILVLLSNIKQTYINFSPTNHMKKQEQTNKNKQVFSQQKKNSKISSQKLPRNSELKFDYLTEQKLDEATHLITQSFINMNNLWKKIGAKYSDVYSVNRGKMISSFKSGQVSAMLDTRNNTIITLAICQDLIDYLNTPIMPNSSNFFKVLSIYSTKLEKQYFDQIKPTLKRGQCIYNSGGAVHMKYAKSNITKKFWAMGMSFLKYSGYEIYYGRATNRITTRLLRSFGGEVVKKIDIQEAGTEGQMMQLVRIQLKNISITALSDYFQEQLTEQQDDLQINSQQ